MPAFRSPPRPTTQEHHIAAAPQSTPPAGSRCLICGYDLAGLDISGVCPECATPIERSLRGNLLRYASPGYIGTLRTGANLVFVAMLLSVFGGLVVGVLGIFLALLNVPSTEPLEVLLDLGTLVAMLFGWWILSTPDPAFVGVDDSRDWRARLRLILPFVSFILLAETVLPFVLGSSLAKTASIGTGAVTVSLSARESLDTLAKFSHGVVIYAGLKYIAALSLRLPSPKIRKESMDAAACMMIVLIALLAVVIFGLGGKIFGFLVFFALIAGGTALVTLLIWLITFLVVMGRLRSELSRTLLTMERGAGIKTLWAEAAPLPATPDQPARADDSIQPPPITQSGSDAS